MLMDPRQKPSGQRPVWEKPYPHAWIEVIHVDPNFVTIVMQRIKIYIAAVPDTVCMIRLFADAKDNLILYLFHWLFSSAAPDTRRAIEDAQKESRELLPQLASCNMIRYKGTKLLNACELQSKVLPVEAPVIVLDTFQITDTSADMYGWFETKEAYIQTVQDKTPQYRLIDGAQEVVLSDLLRSPPLFGREEEGRQFRQEMSIVTGWDNTEDYEGWKLSRDGIDAMASIADFRMHARAARMITLF